MDIDFIEYRKKFHKILSDFAEKTENFGYSDLLKLRELINSVDNNTKTTEESEFVDEKEFFVENPIDNYNIPVSVYIPKNASPYTSIVVFFSGGGFILSTKNTFRRSMRHAAQNFNKIWVTVEYRHSPEYKYPNALEDCLTVVSWVHHYKTKLFNSNVTAKIGVAGDSSGGLLAACVAQRLRSLLSFQILVFPWLHLTCMSEVNKEHLDRPRRIAQNFFEISIKYYLDYPEQGNSSEISPLFNENLEGLPKCLIISGEADHFKCDAYSYHKKLLNNGLNSKLHVIKGAIHGAFHPYLDYLEAFLEVTNEIMCFLKHL